MRIEKYLPEEIPFPSTRFYAYLARRSPFTRDWYIYVAKTVASKIMEGRILDVGTGPGYLPIEIARLIDKVEIIGIDLSSDMIRIAKKNAQKAGITGRVRFEVEDANHMRYEDSVFDLVVSTGSFHHWKEPIRVLNEIYRVLKPRGQALIYELRKDAPKEDLEWLKERYGSLIAIFVYKLVSFHSALTMEEFRKTLGSPKNKFKRFSIEECSPFIMEATLLK